MKSSASRNRNIALGGWLVGILLCCLVVLRTSFTADLSAFLPKSPTKEQQVLLDQLTDGIVSRLILVGLEGGDAATRAALSKRMAQRLRNEPAFVTVNNGEPVHAQKDQAYLFGNRYLLSSAVTPERFTVAGMQAAIGDTIDLLSSPAGMMIKQMVPRDPTGEIVQLFEQMNGSSRPVLQDGAWASRDGMRALLLAQTRASGSDTDGQAEAMRLLRAAFDDAVRQEGSRASEVKLAMTGPGVFSVVSRQTIESEVTRFSILSTVIIVTLLLLVYRSLTALALGLLPVLSGALVGVVAVSLGFGVVHGITLGFGTTLIGEAVDYSIYLFVQSRQPGTAGQEDWVKKFWPTIRLGVLTSIAGFASLLLSDFPGLAQLGLYSIAGLVTAAGVTRFVLPYLLPAGFRVRDVSAIGRRLGVVVSHAPALRLPIIALVIAACVIVFQHRNTMWNSELSALSPVSKADQEVDAKLRADMGAPDVRSMVVVTAANREAALQASEAVSSRLDTLIDKKTIAAYESPSRYLPSVATQRARQESLPGSQAATLLRAAIDGLPVRLEVLQPFLEDLAQAKSHAPLERADLDGTSFALAVDSLLFQRGDRWLAILPLTAPSDVGAIDADAVRAAIAEAKVPNALYVDLKLESDRLYGGYLHQAIMLSLGGVAAVLLLLLWTLRSVVKVAQVVLPLAMVVLVVVALLVLTGQKLILLHLVGMLLIVAVGSNYVLFFTTSVNAKEESLSPQTLTSLFFANMTTVAGFGMLGFSDVPVLQAIGSTVGPGAVLALVFSAAFAARAAKPKG
ncbi:MMPL family transporter [Noviherbaspirillum malthae]|uniref:MMPL family transporter n=1 Tax=Noviherbaspirillum malthae TaxID=1260987 RepID=UPI00188FFD71|nr:MMPL family transporter [Noviherbaspirillum malthae]